MKEHIISGFKLMQPDGGGMRNEEMGIVSTESVAKEWVDSDGEWPRYYEKFHQVVRVFDTLEEMASHDKNELRKRALAKLSIEERKLLGLA